MQRGLLGIAIDNFPHCSIWGSFMEPSQVYVLYALEQLIPTLIIKCGVLKI